MSVPNPERYEGGVHGLDATTPPWRRWRTRSRAARAIRFIEAYCPVPSGPLLGKRIKLHDFQKEQLEQALAEGVRVGGVQIPRGNAKSTLWAAVGVWAFCDDPDGPQVPLVAFNGLQAQRTLWRPIQKMVEMSPELDARVRVFKSSADRRAVSAWNQGELMPLPADVDRLQGLNPTVALVDETQTVDPPVWSALMQGAGKRDTSLVLAIGSPAPGAQDSALFGLRTQAAAGARVAWSEHAADAGCPIDDRRQWHKANPGLAAGLLHIDQLEVELALVSEPEFRAYRLGQWVDAILSDWLPFGAWEACPTIEPPADGTEIVLGLSGTWMQAVAIIGATFDGGVFVVAAKNDAVTDVELEQVLYEAAGRWRVVQLVVSPRQRVNLMSRLEQSGTFVIEPWSNSADLEVRSSTAFRRAIVEGRLPHDHHPLLAEHIGASVARNTTDGSLRLVAPDDGRPVDAARAARMAWWQVAFAAVPAETPAVF